jgi:hypothetical protein
MILKLDAAFIIRTRQTYKAINKPETSLDLLLFQSYHFQKYFEAQSCNKK